MDMQSKADDVAGVKRQAGDRVYIFDTTLRDGEQSPGASMTHDEKLQVTELLDQVRPDGQRMLFSATLDRDVDQLVRDYLRDPAVHSVDPAAAVTAVDHHVFVVHGPDRYAVITEIAARDGRVLLFADTRHGVDLLTRHLRSSGVAAAALHSAKPQPQRTRTLAVIAPANVKPTRAPLEPADRALDKSRIPERLHRPGTREPGSQDGKR